MEKALGRGDVSRRALASVIGKLVWAGEVAPELRVLLAPCYWDLRAFTEAPVLGADGKPMVAGAGLPPPEYDAKAEADEAKKRIDVDFRMQTAFGAPVKVIPQRATIVNGGINTRWALNPSIGGTFLPLCSTPAA